MPINQGLEKNDESGMVYQIMPRGLRPGQPQQMNQVMPASAVQPSAFVPTEDISRSSGEAGGDRNGGGDGDREADGDGGFIRKYLKIILIVIGVIVLIVAAILIFNGIHKKQVAQKAEEARLAEIQINNQAAQQKQQQQQQQEQQQALLVQQQHDQSKIPDEWRLRYFGAAICLNQDNCGDNADPDKDGLTNYEEYTLHTDPNNPDSDGDGIADGDEVHIFHYDPTTKYTTGNTKYSDDYQAKTHWNASAHREFNASELQQIATNIQNGTYAFHVPTITTIGQALVTFYSYYGSPQAGSGVSADIQPGALDRDTQRSDTIKQIGFALLQYATTNNNTFPDTQDFATMITAIKPLLSGKAINTTDPTNAAPYTYGYQSVASGTNFNVSYYSETQHQPIVQDSAAIKKAYQANQAVQRDTTRKNNLEQIAQALELFSNDNANSTDPHVTVFPKQAEWKTDLSPKYLVSIPVDPKTGSNYEYSVNADFTDFALQTLLETPSSGSKGYLCTHDGCAAY